MKILYSAGNRVGADSQLKRFIQANAGLHQIKIAAFIKSSSSFSHIDWTLDALYNSKKLPNSQDLTQLFGHSNIPRIDLTCAEIFLEEVNNYGPELIISDGEEIAAHIANSLGITLWYCSPLHMLDGINWEHGQLSSIGLLENSKKFLAQLPPAEKKFIYSPFGDIEMRPSLKEGYEWIQPYHYKLNLSPEDLALAVVPDPERFTSLTKILNSTDFDLSLFSPFKEQFSHLKVFELNEDDNYKSQMSRSNWFFSTGETSFLSDAFYAGISTLVIAPNLKDTETLLNAQLVQLYKIGYNLSQLEFMSKFAVDEINTTFEKRKTKKFLSQQNRFKLHEKVELHACCI